MMKTLLVGLPLVLLAALASRMLPAAEPEPVQFPTFLPLELWNKLPSSKLAHGYQQGLLIFDTAGRSVTIAWSAGALFNQPLDQSWFGQLQGLGETPYPVADASTYIATRYYPTSAAALDSDTVIIAGAQSDGDTVIEKWTFEWPSPMPAIVASGGVQSVDVVLPQRTEVDVLYTESVPGQTFVRCMAPIKTQGSANTSVMLLFDDSGDLHELDVNSGNLTLLASSSAGLVGPIPELATLEARQLWLEDRVQEGYVYILSEAEFNPSNGAIVLIDPNRDGTVDSYLIVTPAEWEQSWQDANNYIDLWKY